MTKKEEFVLRFREAGGEVVSSLDEALRGLEEASFCIQDRLKRRLGRRLKGLTESPPEEAEVSITRADAAAADTGSVIFGFSEGNDHLLVSLPRVHVVLLQPRRIYKTLLRALARVEGDYISVITGPSKTGDIELIHVAGVHGPERVVVVLEER